MKTKLIPRDTRKWTKFHSRLCDSCFASCCHNIDVQVSVSDLVRLGLIGKEEAQTSLVDAVKRLKKIGVLRASKTGPLVFTLGQKKNLDCVFLDTKTRRCTVYETRPEICRQFPKIGPRPGHCPYVAE